MDQNPLQNLEQEIADLETHEKELPNTAAPSGFAKAMNDKKALLEKVKAF